MEYISSPKYIILEIFFVQNSISNTDICIASYLNVLYVITWHTCVVDIDIISLFFLISNDSQIRFVYIIIFWFNSILPENFQSKITKYER